MSVSLTANRRRGVLLDRASARKVLGVGLPIVGGMMSQNVLDVVDTIMVGQLGEAALAAVGIAAFANFMAVAFLIGLASGVQTLVARRRGEGRHEDEAIPLNGGLAFALAAAIPITIIGVLMAPTIYPMLVAHDPRVVAEGTAYFEARLLGSIAVGLNFSFRGYWYGIGETGTYLRIILTVHIINIILSYGLIFGALGLPELGTLGAGLGTTIALYIGTLLYAITTWRRARPGGFLRALPRGRTLKSLLRLSIPTAVQTLALAAGMTTLFVIAGLVSVTALAVSNVLVNLSKLAVLPAMGLGFAAMTLVSEAIGRGAMDEASRWAWQTVQVAFIAVSVVALVLFFVPQLVVSAFTTEPQIIAAAAVPLMVVSLLLFVEALSAVMGSALNGAGAARTTMLVNIGTQWLFGLPLAYLLGVTAQWGIFGIWLGFSAFRLASAATLTTLFILGRWQSIKL
ncbi:MAG: MATE family efflux transporter [Pseudomonadota bacterium]